MISAQDNGRISDSKNSMTDQFLQNYMLLKRLHLASWQSKLDLLLAVFFTVKAETVLFGLLIEYYLQAFPVNVLPSNTPTHLALCRDCNFRWRALHLCFQNTTLMMMMMEERELNFSLHPSFLSKSRPSFRVKLFACLREHCCYQS